MKDTLLEAMRSSGAILMEYFDKPLYEKVKESQSSIVTEADFASDANITRIIGEKFPEHNIISEESGFIDNNSEYTWIIDPLDGTSNFAAGIPWFGVLITLIRGKEPYMAGAYLPVQDVVFFALKGKGAFRNGLPMKQIPEKSLKECLFSFCVDYTDDEAALNRSMDIYRYLVNKCRNIRSTNCLIDFVNVAEGRFGGVINMFTKIWDIAGLSLLINEAGGTMLDSDGNPLNFVIGQRAADINYPVAAGNNAVIGTLKNEIFGKLL